MLWCLSSAMLFETCHYYNVTIIRKTLRPANEKKNSDPSYLNNKIDKKIYVKIVVFQSIDIFKICHVQLAQRPVS
jgi:hypothetical protein